MSSKATSLGGKIPLIKYQGLWHFGNTISFKSVLAFQRHFHARDTDLIIVSHPKTGTTWLKSFLFSVVNHDNQQSTTESTLTSHHPHELVYRLEGEIYSETFPNMDPNHLNELPSPRLFSTHLTYTSLPESIKSSGCRVLYIGRNPLDTCVSQWHFHSNAAKKTRQEDFQTLPIEEYFEEFYQGMILNGPFFEHVVEYLRLSLKRSDKVLFLKYEELKDDFTFQLKRLAEFVGLSFSPEEESQGVVEEIIRMCNIKNLKELEVNKSGVINRFFYKNTYFRKGEVGD